MTTCPLCGHRFDEGALSACSSCPMSRECATICCPNCGYQFVEHSWIVEKIRALKEVIVEGASGRKGGINGT
jgi:hypothetical protein